jgi:adenosylcobinamide-GDP ribazoletransferase
VNGIAAVETILTSDAARVNFDARFAAMSALVLAIRYLTIVPVPGGRHAAAGLGRSAPWFPVVGAGIGLLLVITDRLTARVFPSWVSAVLTVSVWKAITGGLHLDGVADCLDGLAGRDREQRLAIMRDSRIGSFGAAGLVLLLLLEVVAVAELPAFARWRVLLVAPVIARAVPPVLARLFGAARTDGQGAAFIAGVGTVGAALALVVATLVAFVALGPAGVTATALALGVVAAGAVFLSRRLGGLTGDVLGAAVEGAEVVVLLAVLAWLGGQG